MYSKPAKLFSYRKAVKIALYLNEAEEDGWQYRTEVKGKYTAIKVYDSKGEFVGYL